LLLPFGSCNSFIDEQLPPDNGPMAGAIQSIIQRYPKAEDIRFSTLDNNKLWQANFTQQRQSFQALVDPAQMLFATQLVDSGLPDSLTRLVTSTVVAGGAFAKPRFHQWEKGWSSMINPDDASVYVWADYTWQQQPYTAYWVVNRRGPGESWYNFKLLPFQQASYTTDLLTDIPEAIQRTLRDQNLTFTYAWVQLDGRGQRSYNLSVNRQSQYWNLTFKEDGQMIAVNSPSTAHFFQEFDQLPSAIQAYLHRPELAGFDLGRKGGPANAYARNTYGSLITYAITVEKGKEAWDLVFSENGQLITRTYRLYGSF
jgi:hypothetical protein